jgi:hypothetical protein
MIPVKTTTPKKITDTVRQLCNKLDRSQKPQFVAVKPEVYCHADNCFFNLPEKIKRDGGTMQLGWTIWEMSNVMLEAELHAVWVSPEGRFVDITPKRDGEKKILFHPDSTRSYNREPVDNVRMALQNDPAIHEFMRISARLIEIRKQYMIGPATAQGVVSVIPPFVQLEMQELALRGQEVLSKILRLNRGK